MARPRNAPWLLAAVVWGGLVVGGPAAAHRLAPALLEIEEAVDGTLAVHFKVPRLRAGSTELVAELPDHCTPASPLERTADAASLSARWTMHCGQAGLVGARIGVAGLAGSGSNAVVRIALHDGRGVQAVLHEASPSLRVPARPSPLAVFRDYLRLGVEHIAGGFDHLLFVFGLLLLASGTRPLLATVSAFTAGHSVTLSAAALGWVHVPSALVEWVIALTIGVLALELARRPTRPDAALRRRPWAVAFAFGLLHGFGFAGALAELGLPEGEIPLALFSFNVGIELGQLVFVAGVLAVRAASAPLWVDAPDALRRLPATAMGGLAFYWCLDRASALW